MQKVVITTEYLKLQDILKLASVTSTGGEAKLRILNGEVRVNGEVCIMRGKKIRPGDIVSVDGQEYTAVYAVQRSLIEKFS